MKQESMLLKQLQEKRSAKMSEMDDLIKKIEGDDDNQARSFTTEEQSSFDILDSEIRDLDAKIKTQEQILEHKKRSAEAQAARLKAQGKLTPGGEQRSKKEAISEYSFLRAIRAKLEGKQLEGIEAEMQQEAEQEARQAGRAVEGIGVPSFFIDQRDHTVASDPSLGVTVATALGPLIPALRPRLRLRELGVNVMTGLQGNFDMPRQNSLMNAEWEGEIDESAETTITADKVQMSPKRLAAWATYSRQLLYQSSVDVEAMVRQELSDAIGRNVDQAGIAGVAGVIDGILGTAGIGAVTSGGTPSRETLVALETAIADADADIGTLAFLTNPKVKGLLKNTKTDAGSGLFVWGENSDELLGYRAAVTTLVPDDLTGTNSALIFGNFSQMSIGQWGGIDLLVNPYSLDRTAQIRVTINSFWDIAVRQPKAFAACLDIATP